MRLLSSSFDNQISLTRFVADRHIHKRDIETISCYYTPNGVRYVLFYWETWV